MSMVAVARRVGPFVLFADRDGLRHAIRLQGVLALCDADELRDSTVMVISGGRVAVIPEPLEEVLAWFS